MKTKIKAIAVGGLVLSSSFGLAFAEDQTEQEPATNEIQAVTTTADNFENFEERKIELKENRLIGNSQLRVLGLQTALSSQIESTKIIIEKLNEKQVETADLEIIASTFDSLLVELNSIDLENTDYEQVKVQVENIKEQSKANSEEFKELVSELFTDEEKLELRKLIQKQKDQAKQEIKAETEALRNEIYVQNIQSFMERFGIENPELVEKFQSGEIEKSELRQNLAEILKTLKTEKVEEIKEQRTKEKIERKAQFEIVKENFQADRKEFSEKLKADRENLRELYNSDKEEFKNQMEQMRFDAKALIEKHREEFKQIGKIDREKLNELKEKFGKYQSVVEKIDFNQLYNDGKIPQEFIDALNEADEELTAKLFSEDGLTSEQRKELFSKLSPETLEEMRGNLTKSLMKINQKNTIEVIEE